MEKIRDFTDLIVWKKAHQLVLSIYIICQKFPKSEIWGLTSQMQRAAVSVTSNIAEGFARRSKKEKLQFYFTALGSLSELLSQLMVCRDLEYITPTEFEKIEQQITEVRKLLNGLIKSSESYA